MYTDKELSAMNGLNPPIRGSIELYLHGENLQAMPVSIPL